MNFVVEYLSFYVVEQPQEENSVKQVIMQKVLSHDEYAKSELKEFLHEEFAKVAKRKVDMTPKTEASPTKLGQFIVEEGHALDSNPNYAQFRRLLTAEGKEAFKQACVELVHSYLKTSGVRGGVLLISRVRLEKFDQRFLFLFKCDFEAKTAVITDEQSLLSNVEMAINAKNMKSIMYPYLLEEGMIDEYLVKIHQFSHARYFEEFLKFIEYQQTVSEIVTQEVLSLARQHIDYTYPEPSIEREQEEEAIELLAAKPKRELSEKWEHETVMEAMQIITEKQPDIDLTCKLDHMQIKAKLADYGSQVHIATVNNRYMILLEGDLLQFEKGFSPVEFLKPKKLHEIVKEIEQRGAYPAQQNDDSDDTPPW